jgi:hypothetical protein
MRFVVLIMAIALTYDNVVDSKPQNKVGVITVSIADTLPALSLAAL